MQYLTQPYAMSKSDHDLRRDSVNSYFSPARSAQGTPGRHYTHMHYNDPTRVPNQQYIDAQSVSSPRNAQGTPIHSYTQIQSDGAIRLPNQQQMNAQSFGSSSSIQGTPSRHYTSVSYNMSPMTGTSPGINMAQAAVSGGEYTINAHPLDQLAREPLPFLSNKFGRQLTDAQLKEMRLLKQQQSQMNAQSYSMNPQSRQQYRQFQPQQVSQQLSQPPQSGTQAKPFAIVENVRHYTREVEKDKRYKIQEFGRKYFAAMSLEHKQRFRKLQPQQQYQEVYQQFVQQGSLEAQLLQQKQQPHHHHHQQQQQQRAQPPQLAPQQQPVFQHQQPRASPAIHTSNIPTLNVSTPKISNQGLVGKNGKQYTKEEVQALNKLHVKRNKEQRIAALAAAHRAQVQAPSRASGLDTSNASLIGGEQPGFASAAHMNKLAGHGAGTKRSLPDGDSAYEDGRSRKAAMISKASDPRCSSIGAAATGPVRKVAATKQPKSQDATLHKKPRGRPPKDPKMNETLAKQVPTMEAPAVPTRASNHSKANAHKVVGLPQPEKAKPISLFPYTRTPEAIALPIEVNIGQPAEHQSWLHSHPNGVSMADVELGSSIRDNMNNYLSELDLHRRTSTNRIAKTPSTPLFTDNTMSNEHAKALGLPTGFDILPILSKVRDPNYDGFATYSRNNDDGDFFEKPQETQNLSVADAMALETPFKVIGTPDPDSQPHCGLHTDVPMAEPCDQLLWDLPEVSQVTEESALLCWGLLQQTKNRENNDNWGADIHGKSTWN